MKDFWFILFFIFSLSVSTIFADSHEHHDDEGILFEEHTSHVHGHAITQISHVGSILKINQTLSSIDVFGFEHAPENTKQKNIIMQSIETLENSKNLFHFKNKACELASVQTESELAESDNDSLQDHAHQNHDSHEDEHHHDHDEEHHDNDTEEESHTDVIANYIFKCDSKKLETIEYLIFDHFPSLEEIEVQYISDHHQALFNATPSNRVQKLH